MCCTEPEGRHVITVPLRPVKTSWHFLLYPLTILLSSPLHLQILPQPPWEWLCPCANSCAPLPPDLSIQSHPSPYLTHRRHFLAWGTSSSWSRALESWIIFIPMELRKSWDVRTGFTVLLFGSFLREQRGPALDQRSHITPETYRTAAASVSKEHRCVPALALPKQRLSRCGAGESGCWCCTEHKNQE